MAEYGPLPIDDGERDGDDVDGDEEKKMKSIKIHQLMNLNVLNMMKKKLNCPRDLN